MLRKPGSLRIGLFFENQFYYSRIAFPKEIIYFYSLNQTHS